MPYADSDGPVVLLRMVRAERLQADADLLRSLQQRFPDRELLWATTESGARVLQRAGSVPVLVLSTGGFSPGALRAAVTCLRAAQPAACVLGYDTPARRGNLLLELLALLGGVPELWWAVDGERVIPLRRGGLRLRIACGLALAGLYAALGLLGGCLVGLLLPALAVIRRRGHGSAPATRPGVP